MMHHPILQHHNKTPHPQDAQHNNHATHITLGDVVHLCQPRVSAELNGKAVSMWCAPFTLTVMLGDVNHWLIDKHGVFSDTRARGAHHMLVIGETHSLNHSIIFSFSPSFSPTLFCLCFPSHLILAHSFWFALLHNVVILRELCIQRKKRKRVAVTGRGVMKQLIGTQLLVCT